MTGRLSKLITSLITVALIAVTEHGSASGPSFATEAEQRVVAFLKNAHTGKAMNEQEWLSRRMRSSAEYRDFGGMESLVRSSTQRAQRFGGLKEIRVLRSKTNAQGSVTVEVEMEFTRAPKDSSGGTSIDDEELKWFMTVVHEEGGLKLEF